MPRPQSAALPIAYVVLRILVVLNWVLGVGIVALLLIVPHEQWILQSFKLAPSPDADRLVMALRAIAVLGIVATPVNHIILTRLLAIVGSVRAGDPFVAANAARLQVIGWALVGLQFIGLTIGALAKAVSTAAHPLHMNAGFSVTGWLVVLLVFVLARVFAEGSAMRDDLEGTV